MTIYDSTGAVVYEAPITTSAIIKRVLMGDYYIELTFDAVERIDVGRGCYILYDGHKFEIMTNVLPDDSNTGGLRYTLKFEAQQSQMKRCKVFWRDSSSLEVSFSNTTSLSSFGKLIVENVNAFLGSNNWSLGSISDDKSLKTVSFNGDTCWDAVATIAETFGVEWWTEESGDNVSLCFGKLEYGSEVEFRRGDVVSSIPSKRGDNANYGTRFYVFGSTKNLPSDYLSTSEGGIVNHIVEKRLHLPDGIDYIDAWENLAQEDVVEQVVFFDDIFPPNVDTVTSVDKEAETVIEGRYDFVYTLYCADTPFTPDNIIDGEQMQINFTSGDLMGQTFDVEINADSFDKKFRIVPNVYDAENGILLPNDNYYPKSGDTFILLGIELPKSRVTDAENLLLETGREYAQKNSNDTEVYDCPTNAVYCHKNSCNYDLGQRVLLLGDKFGTGRSSRIQGYEKKLYDKYQAVYTVGDNSAYSRLAAVEKSIRYNAYSDRVGLDANIIRSKSDSTIPSDYNVYSALATLEYFLHKNRGGTVKGHTNFAKGLSMYGKEIKYDADKNVFIFPCNILAEGGIAWNSSLDGFDPQTIAQAVKVDWSTIGQKEDGTLYVIGGTGIVGPQGPQGNSGYTGAADELEVVNNLTQGGATAALSAEMGKELTNISLNKNLIGKNNEMVRVKCRLAKGVTYQCYLPIERWDLSGVTLDYNYEYFSIGYFVGDEFTAIRTFLSNYDDYKAEFTFEAPIYGDYQLSVRATEGINVPIAVMPITINYDDPATRLFKGKNNEMIRANYHFAKGLTYQCYLPIERWDLSGVTLDYNYGYFELGYFNEGNEFVAVKTLVRDSVKHEASFTFEAPTTGAYQVSIRATEGVDVPISIAPTDAGENEPNKILSGKGNTLVKSRFQLIKGISYACYLQGEQWDLSGVTLDYNYVYFELGYFNEDDVWVEIAAYRSDFNNYKPTFAFEAPTTGAYQVSIRATEGTDVPIVIMPTSEAQVDVFAEQLSKAKNLGFAATYSQVEGYIPTLTFMHVSDTHCTNVSYTAPFRRTIDICNTLSAGAINKGRNVKFLLHTGDVRNAQYSDGYEFFADVTASLKPNIYVTAGNHDVGNSWEVAQCGTDEQIYAEMIEPMLASWNLKSDGGGTPHPEGKNYYFTDFTDEKVRLIVLYEYETDFELSVDDPAILRGERGIRSFRQTQIDWLINSLQTTPAGYGVVIAKHQPEATNGYFDNPFSSSIAPESVKMQSYCGSTIIAEIVQAFIDRREVDYSVAQTGNVVTTLSAKADFSTVAEGAEFIFYCSGHTHLDIVNFLRDYPKQLELNIGCNNIHYTSGTDMLQEEGEKSQNLINVYNIDRNRGYVYIVRIGADFSNTAQDRSFTAIKYRKDE